MDLGSIIGFIVFFVATIVTLVMTGSNVMGYINPSSIILVLGGTIGAALIACDLETVKTVPKMLGLFMKKSKYELQVTIKLFVSLAEVARKEGILALERRLEEVEDPFIHKGIQLLVDGTEPEMIRDIMETELVFLDQRHKQGIKFFQTCGSLAPAFGLFGTLMGLINMLRSLNDPEALGPAMAVALVTTLYGVLLSNVVFNPIGEKLSSRNAEELNMKEIVIEGILSIQSGDNPRIVEEKLKTFLSPKERDFSEKEAKPGKKKEKEEEVGAEAGAETA